MKKRTLWLIIIGIAVLAAFGFLFLRGGGDDRATYRMEKVSRGTVAVRISATGTLSAVTTVQIGSQVSGTIAKLYADFNSRVTKGMLLAQLDPTFLQATVNEQRASVSKARAQVNDAERNYARTRELSEKSLVAQADMDAATTALESARATLAQAQAGLDRAEVNLRYATIRAPISGVVISRNVDVGQTVAASLQAPTLFTIANDLRKMQVQANIDEADIGNVQVGQRVRFRVDAFPEQEFTGRVSQIRLAPVVTQNVVMYSVIIDVENPEEKLMPGMTATVYIQVAERDDVLRVPIQATRFTPPGDEGTASRQGMPQAQGEARPARSGAMRPQGDGPPRRDGGGQRAPRARVWVLDNGKPTPVSVTRGLQDDRFVEVSGGDLKEGDEVIVGTNSGNQVQQQPAQSPFGPQRMPGGGGRRGF